MNVSKAKKIAGKIRLSFEALDTEPQYFFSQGYLEAYEQFRPVVEALQEIANRCGFRPGPDQRIAQKALSLLESEEKK